MTNRKSVFLSAWTLILLLVATATNATTPQPLISEEQQLVTPLPGSEQWVLYKNANFGFTFEYPSDWAVITLIEQRKPYAEPDKIIRKDAFAGPEGYTTLSIFLSNGLDLSAWLKVQNETSPSLFPAMGTNGTVDGHPAAFFLVDDNLIVFTEIGEYIFRLWHPISEPLALQANWHMVNSFRNSEEGTIGASAEIPESVLSEVRIVLEKPNAQTEQASSCTAVQGQGCCDLPALAACYQFPCARDAGQDKGNCTYLVCYKYGGVPFSGNAGTWWGQVPTTPGWYSHTNPPKGTSIAWWGGSPGHVGYIQYYSGSGTPSVIEQSYCDYCTRTRSTWAQGYIQKGHPPAKVEADSGW